MTTDQKKKPAPSYLPMGLLLGGLGALYLGERALDDMARYVVSGLGGLSLLASLGLALSRIKKSDGQRRTAAKRIVIEYGVGIVALLVYFLLASGTVAADGKLHTMLQVIWPAVLLLALVPAIAMEMAFLSMARAPELELWRIRFAGRGARIIALAIVAFAGLNFASNKWNSKIDLSYFKTTKPGTSTAAIVEHLTKPLEFVLFFNAGNDVLEQARDYTESLAGNNALATVKVVDQALDPELARDLRVRANGYLVLRSGDKSESIRIGMDLEDARSTLRELDAKVQESLLKVLKPPRVAYFTTGHGERDYSPQREDKRPGLRDFRKVLEMLGFKVKRLGLTDGLGSEIPGDASVVIIAGPTEPFLSEEREALIKYAKAGGRLFVFIDPDSVGGEMNRGTIATEDALLAELGVKVSEQLVANEQYQVRLKDSGPSPYNLVTTRATSHPSVEAVSGSGNRLAVVLLGAGKLSSIESPPAETKVTMTLRSMQKSWLDLNHNRKLDQDTEKEEAIDFAAAIERPVTGDNSDALRAIVVADADIAGDGVVPNPGNSYFLADGVRWLVDDEETAGTVESEKDVPVVHREDEDTIWFYGTSIIIPIIVLSAGLLISRKKQPKRRAS